MTSNISGEDVVLVETGGIDTLHYVENNMWAGFVFFFTMPSIRGSFGKKPLKRKMAHLCSYCFFCMFEFVSTTHRLLVRGLLVVRGILKHMVRVPEHFVRC